VEVPLNELGKKVKIGSQLSKQLREELESFLRSNSNVFA